VLVISSSKPKISKWNTTNITLLGDAIHPMVPIGGVGANTALHDAEILCDAIKNGCTMEDIMKYEEEMREFAIDPVQQSYMAASKMQHVVPIDEAKPIA